MNSNKSNHWQQALQYRVDKCIENATNNIINSNHPSLWRTLDIGGFGFVEEDLGKMKFCWNHERNKRPEIKKVIFHAPATIVYWSDGDKTVVKANNELFDREKGLAMAISKKFLGGKGNYFNTFRKFIEGEE